MAFESGQWGPDTFIDNAGNTVLIGATVTASGYVCTVDSLGNLTVTGPADDSVTLTVTPATGAAYTQVVPVRPLTSELETVQALAVAASTTYAPGGGNYGRVYGDSTARGTDNDPANPYWRRHSWVPYGCVLSGQQANGENKAVGEETSTQAVARLAADIADGVDLGWAAMLAGRNDATAAVTKASVDAFVTACLSNGIKPVLCTLCPANASDTKSIDRERNAYIRNKARSTPGAVLVDFHAELTDPLNGGWITGYDDGGGVHQSDLGFRVMAEVFARAMTAALPPWRPWLPDDNTDPNNKISNGLFLAQSGGNPTGWTNGNGTNRSARLVADRDIKGNWWEHTFTGTTGTTQLYNTGMAAADFAPGEVNEVVGRIWTDDLVFTGSTKLQIVLAFDNAPTYTQYRPIADWELDLHDGVFHLPFVPPAGATDCDFVINVGACSGKLAVAQIGLRNRTDLGLGL